MILNVNLITERIFYFSPISYLVLNFLRFMFNMEVFYFLTLLLCFYGLVLFVLLVYYQLIARIEIVFILSLLLFSFIQFLFMRNNTFSIVIQFFINFMFAISFFYSKFNKSVFASLFIIIFLFLLSNFILGNQPEDVFIVSRNFISVIALLSMSFYLISCCFDMEDKGKFSIFISFLMVLICFWGIGRSGIAISLFIFLFLVVSYFTYRVTLLRIFIVAVILFALLVSSNMNAVIDCFNSNGFFQVGLERFYRLGGGGQRSYINTEYIELISSDITNLFFGGDLSHVKSIMEVDGNPHNSFINLHIAFGLFGVLLFLGFLSVSIFKSLLKGHCLIIVVLISSLFRASVDIAAFNGPLDVIIIYCIFFSMRHRSVRKKYRGLSNA